MNLALSKFYLEHQFSKSNIGLTEEELLELIEACYVLRDPLEGYRPGVILVELVGVQLPHPVVKILPGEKLEASYLPRVEGEDPRLKVQVYRKKLPLSRTTFAVLYHKDVLALTNERSSEAEWEVVAHVTSSINEPEPMHPDTLLANHFELSGGTPTGMNPEKFQEELKKSVLFWKDRAYAVRPRPWYKRVKDLFRKGSLIDWVMAAFSVLVGSLIVTFVVWILCSYASYLGIYGR